MIVCVCKFVSDRAVRRARDAGARTVEAIAAATGAGTGCGSCKGAIELLLAEPCAAAPEREASGEAVPRRVAAGGVTTP